MWIYINWIVLTCKVLVIETRKNESTKMLEKNPGYRRHPMWRSNFDEQTTDSGGESQPLLSSDNSRTSNTSYA